MKTYSTNQIKNIVLLGNAGSGKTTLAEAMLFEGGVIDRRGDIAARTPFLTIIPSSRKMQAPYSQAYLYRI